MRSEERQKFILKAANDSGFVSISDVAGKLEVSVETVRRDINKLCEVNLLRKSFGGAVPIKLALRKDNEYAWRKRHNLQEKMAIGAEAAKLIRSNSVVAFSSGSSIEALIPFIPQVHNVIFVTGSISVASSLIDRIEEGCFDGKLVLIGGEINLQDRFSKGSMAIDEIDRYNFDLSFLSCSALSERGASLYGVDESIYAAHLMKHSTQTVLVAESTKVAKVSLYTYASITDFSKIIIGSTGDIPKAITDALEKSNTELTIVKKE